MSQVIGNCFQNFIIVIQMHQVIADITIDRIMLLIRQEKQVLQNLAIGRSNDKKCDNIYFGIYHYNYD
jgi:hypothetical protein